MLVRFQLWVPINCTELALSLHCEGAFFYAQFKYERRANMYINYNTNPLNKRVGDCVVRAISTVLGESWDTVYLDLTEQGFQMKDMPSANHVWGEYLSKWGFYRNAIPNTCPACYTVRDFCKEHTKGTYLLATGTHVVAVMDGNWYDTWNSGDEVPVYYWKRSEIHGI